jgi:hypothetical protein
MIAKMIAAKLTGHEIGSCLSQGLSATMGRLWCLHFVPLKHSNQKTAVDPAVRPSVIGAHVHISGLPPVRHRRANLHSTYLFLAYAAAQPSDNAEAIARPQRLIFVRHDYFFPHLAAPCIMKLCCLNAG